jgi:hypothetical protein
LGWNEWKVGEERREEEFKRKRKRRDEGIKGTG